MTNKLGYNGSQQDKIYGQSEYEYNIPANTNSMPGVIGYPKENLHDLQGRQIKKNQLNAALIDEISPHSSKHDLMAFTNNNGGYRRRM